MELIMGTMLSQYHLSGNTKIIVTPFDLMHMNLISCSLILYLKYKGYIIYVSSYVSMKMDIGTYFKDSVLVFLVYHIELPRYWNMRD